MLSITAELGRALAVVIVKVTLQVNGNSQFLAVFPQKTMGAIKIKSGTNDYVGEGNPDAKYGNSGITGGGSPHDHFWEFWDPLHMSATAEARNWHAE